MCMDDYLTENLLSIAGPLYKELGTILRIVEVFFDNTYQPKSSPPPTRYFKWQDLCGQENVPQGKPFLLRIGRQYQLAKSLFSLPFIGSQVVCHASSVL